MQTGKGKHERETEMYFINVINSVTGESLQTFHETNQIIAWRIINHLEWSILDGDLTGYKLIVEKGE